MVAAPVLCRARGEASKAPSERAFGALAPRGRGRDVGRVRSGVFCRRPGLVVGLYHLHRWMLGVERESKSISDSEVKIDERRFVQVAILASLRQPGGHCGYLQRKGLIQSFESPFEAIHCMAHLLQHLFEVISVAAI